MKVIYLTQGKSVLVDDSDYAYLMQWKWYVTVHGYAARMSNKKDQISGSRKTITMHSVLLRDAKLIDHIDTNRLNNQKYNLRAYSHRENSQNRRVHKNNICGYKGVRYYKQTNKYQARISVNHKEISLGYYYNIKDAAIAYNKAAKKYFGSFARTNKING